LRAYFFDDYYKETGVQFDYYAQSLSSAFGPIGLYRGFREMEKNNILAMKPPKLLGI
jgi:hypothetical protein